MVIAICDDNEKERLALVKIIQEIMERFTISYSLVEFGSGESLLEAKMTFDIIFLDIVMDGLNGIEIGRKIYRKNNVVKIIFQTSYGQYCKIAVNYSHAYAYLEKPLQKSEVEGQIQELIDNHECKREIKINFENICYEQHDKLVREKVVSLVVDDIIYFEYIKSKREIKIVTENVIYRYPGAMSKLVAEMRPFGFEVSCRGVLINLKNVKGIKGYTIYLKQGTQMPLSQKRAIEFKERMNEYMHSYIHNSLN